MKLKMHNFWLVSSYIYSCSKGELSGSEIRRALLLFRGLSGKLVSCEPLSVCSSLLLSQVVWLELLLLE